MKYQGCGFGKRGTYKGIPAYNSIRSNPICHRRPISSHFCKIPSHRITVSRFETLPMPFRLNWLMPEEVEVTRQRRFGSRSILSIPYIGSGYLGSANSQSCSFTFGIHAARARLFACSRPRGWAEHGWQAPGSGTLKCVEAIEVQQSVHRMCSICPHVHVHHLACPLRYNLLMDSFS